MDEMTKYSEDYNEKSFWKKIKDFGVKAGLKVIYLALVLFQFMKDKNTPLKHKGMIVAALGYFILPTDIIPDFLGALGFTDDFGVMIAVFNVIKDYVTEENYKKAKTDLLNVFPNIKDPDVEDLIN